MELINGISMIPFGLLAGFMNEKEIRITELAEEGFRFRLAEKLTAPESFSVCFYDMETGDYNEIRLWDYELEEVKKQPLDTDSEICPEDWREFCTEYVVYIRQEDYRKQVRQLIGQYSRYIRLKLSGDDGELSHVLTGYPVEKDYVFAESLEEQRKEWFDRPDDEESENYGKIKDKIFEIALELDRPELYEEYLELSVGEMAEKYREWKIFTSELNKKPDRLYIGNCFCYLLFPEEKTLFSMIEKAKSESVAVTLSFPWIREFMLTQTKELLDHLENWGRENDCYIEVVVNDWAMADMIKKYTSHIIPCLGILLNKRKKDPRFLYKKGNKNLYKENNLNAEFYRKYLKEEFGIERYEWESCGYPQIFPEGKNSLHIPFFQTNTSQYCTLRAVCTTGNRGCQKLPVQCPQYCSKYGFLYPKHLNMTGRYNSLFGLDRELVKNPGKLQEYRKAGTDRVVIGLL